ncbi:MAG: hypothetical protein AW09_000218 [Candidatus Accumulibacter phosphatis]|uniref:Uncharacterized protein n=1 Tax=Candidatus Accumulibacter phosphatis TaxID=327160 RepID=A0A080LZR7_9PROT|nr:MAG: hypothetical protein AW09_000218 [Candidatus Accumulibacter phosphatis]
MEGFAAVLAHQRRDFAENDRHAVALKWNSHSARSGFTVPADRASHGIFLVTMFGFLRSRGPVALLHAHQVQQEFGCKVCAV